MIKFRYRPFDLARLRRFPGYPRRQVTRKLVRRLMGSYIEDELVYLLGALPGGIPAARGYAEHWNEVIMHIERESTRDYHARNFYDRVMNDINTRIFPHGAVYRKRRNLGLWPLNKSHFTVVLDREVW